MTREEDLISAILLHDHEQIDALLKHKDLNVNYIQGEFGKGGSSILTIAAGTGQIDTVRKLIKRGANVNCNNRSSSQTPLQAAVRFGSKEIVELLFEHGADVRVPCAYPGSLLMEAAYRGHFTIAKILIKQKADIHFANQYKHTALDEALKKGHPKLILLLSNLSAKSTEMNRHEDYYHAVLELLRKKPVNVHQKFTDYGDIKLSFLTFAVKESHWQIAKILHSKGAKHYSDDKEMTLLHYSTYNGSTHTVQWVLSCPEYRVALNKFTDPTLGSTPLGLACEQGFDGVIRLLVENGASLELKNSFDESPILKAYKHPRTQTVQLLIDLGTDPNLIKPYSNSRIMEAYHIDFHEKCLIVQSCLDPRIVKLLACLVQIEYFKNTQDCLLFKHEKLLDLLIKKFAEHASNVILQHNIAAITKRLLMFIENKRTFDNDQDKAQFIQKEIDKCRDMIATSLINRLTTHLCKPPLYFLQSYLNFQLHTKNKSMKPLTADICGNAMERTSFFSHVHSSLDDVLTGLELLGFKLSEFDRNLHFRFPGLSKTYQLKSNRNDDVKEALDITSGTGDTGDTKELQDNSFAIKGIDESSNDSKAILDRKSTHESSENFIQSILKIYTALHESRLELAKRIIEKYNRAQLRDGTKAATSLADKTATSDKSNTASTEASNTARSLARQTAETTTVTVFDVKSQSDRGDTKQQMEGTINIVSEPSTLSGSNTPNVMSLYSPSRYQNVGLMMGQVFQLLESEHNNDHRNTIHSIMQQVSENVSQASLLKAAQLLLEKIHIMQHTPLSVPTQVVSRALAAPAPQLLTPQLNLQQSQNQADQHNADESNRRVADPSVH